MAVNPVDAMTWKARELRISYGILLTQITEEERQEILEEYGGDVAEKRKQSIRNGYAKKHSCPSLPKNVRR